MVSYLGKGTGVLWWLILCVSLTKYGCLDISGCVCEAVFWMRLPSSWWMEESTRPPPGWEPSPPLKAWREQKADPTLIEKGLSSLLMTSAFPCFGAQTETSALPWSQGCWPSDLVLNKSPDCWLQILELVMLHSYKNQFLIISPFLSIYRAYWFYFSGERTLINAGVEWLGAGRIEFAQRDIMWGVVLLPDHPSP